MTKEIYNSLPLEARNFIQKHAGCLSCGNAEAKLTKGYALYLTSKKMNTYTIFGGGVNYSQNGQTGVLRAVNDLDTPFEIREKISIAKAIHATSPHLFMVFNVEAMDALIESLPADEVVDLDVTDVTDATDDTDDTDATDATDVTDATDATEKGFNASKASYEELKDFVKDNGIEVKGNAPKKELIKAIEALADTDGNELL